MTENIEQLLRKKIEELDAISKSADPNAIEKVREILTELTQLTQQPEKTIVVPSNLEEALKTVDRPVVLVSGRYKIDFDITITSNGKLEIEPGTEITFGEKGGILAYGVLSAVGAIDRRIIFTGQDDSWRNISFAGRYSTPSQLAYCTIKRGRGRKEIKSESYFGGFECPETHEGRCGGAILIAESSPTITNCLIEGNKAWYGGGIFMQSSDAIVLENEIRGNTAKGYESTQVKNPRFWSEEALEKIGKTVQELDEKYPGIRRRREPEIDKRFEGISLSLDPPPFKPLPEPEFLTKYTYYGRGGGIYVRVYCNTVNVARNVIAANKSHDDKSSNVFCKNGGLPETNQIIENKE